jgi:hypothetical protein
MIVILLLGNTLLAEANETTVYENSRTKEEILECLTKKNLLTEEEAVKVSEDLQILNDNGATIGCIEDVRMKDGNNIFLCRLDETTTSELEVEKTSTNDIVIKISENDIYNEVVIKPDGTKYLDGKQIGQELVTESMNSNQRTGGFTWYEDAEAPSYLLNAVYGTYTVTERNVNVPLTNFLNAITYQAFKMVLAAYSGLSLTFIDMTFRIFDVLRTDSPNSDALSYITYTAKCINNVRYLRRYTVLYPRGNYGGTPQYSFRYGVLL